MTINEKMHAETIESLDCIKAVAEALRLGKWDAGIKTLTKAESEFHLKLLSDLSVAIPAVIEQLQKRIQTSIRQGQHSLEMKRKKREEREATAHAAAPKAETADAPVEQEEDKLEPNARKAEGEDT